MYCTYVGDLQAAPALNYERIQQYAYVSMCSVGKYFFTYRMHATFKLPLKIFLKPSKIVMLCTIIILYMRRYDMYVSNQLTITY